METSSVKRDLEIELIRREGDLLTLACSSLPGLSLLFLSLLCHSLSPLLTFLLSLQRAREREREREGGREREAK